MSTGVLGDELLGSARDLLYEFFYVDLHRWRDGPEVDVALVVLDKDAIGQDVVIVAVEIQQGTESLHKGDRTAHRKGKAESSCLVRFGLGLREQLLVDVDARSSLLVSEQDEPRQWHCLDRNGRPPGYFGARARLERSAFA